MRAIEDQTRTAPEGPLVSVIVPTRNVAAYLERCLVSIRRQTYRPLEIVVVDNSSTDDTVAIARRYADLVLTAGPERSAQVNRGVEASHGEFVYRVDGDFELDSRVVEQCVARAQEGFDAVVVHNSPDAAVGRLARIRNFEVGMYKYSLEHSGARFVRRDVFEAIGGYSESITAGEDYDLQNRLAAAGCRTGFVDAEAVHLDEPTSLLPNLRKYYEYGKDFVNFRETNPRTQLAFARPTYFRHWRRFRDQPIIGSQFIAYHVAKFTAGGLGYVVALSEARLRRLMPGRGRS